MANMRNFRVAINLSNFFHDHRNRARIFINNDTQTIHDLEERIEKIFHIKNFHLTSQNEFLPSSEDVRILQQNDIIWVMPNTYEEPIMPKTSAVASDSKNIKSKKRSVSLTQEYIEECFPPSKKKKKKIFDFEKSKDDEEATAVSSTKERSKKKNKQKDNVSCMNNEVDITTETEQMTHTDKKKKKKKLSSDSNNGDSLENDTFTKNKGSALKINTLLPVLQLHISSYNKKLNKANNLETPPLETSTGSEQYESQPDVKTTKESYKCKGSLSSYKKRVPVPTITEKYLKEKKINIVKIEYLSGGPSQLKQPELLKYNDSHKNYSLEESSPELGNNEVQNLTEYKIGTGSIDNDNSNINDISENADTSEYTVSNKDDCIKQTGTDLTFKYCDLLPISKDDMLHTNLTKENYQITCDESKMERYTDEVEIDHINNTTLGKSVSGHINKSSNENIMAMKCSISPMNNSRKDMINNLNCSLKRSIESLYPNIDTYTDITFNQNVTDAVTSNNNNSLLSTETMNVEKDVNTPFSKLVTPLKDQSNRYQVTGNNSSTNYDDISPPSLKLDTWGDKQCEMQPLREISQNKINEVKETGSYMNVLTCIEGHADEPQQFGDMYVNVSDKTGALVNNLTAETDILNENISSESKVKLIDETVTEEATNLSDIKYPDVHNDITATLDPLSVCTISNHEKGSTFKRRKQVSGVGQLLEELRSNESLVTGESLDSDPSEEFITKRRRKRVRKKRTKSNKSDYEPSLNDSSFVVTPKYVPKPLATKACPVIHLKFEEDGECLKAVDVTEKKSRCEQGSDSYMETSFIESITIESDVEGTNSQNFNIKEEIILKSPSIKNSLPKIGDIVAFKILRITENYTPEVSTYIIGKVLEFNSDSKTVFYEILNGLEQCDEPKGTLTIGYEGNDVNVEKGNKREFAWMDLIDPRLLFP